MHKRQLLYPTITAFLILMTILPVRAAQFAPAVFVIDQDVVDGTVLVTRVTSNVPGWIVIHADDNGKPGPVLGESAVPSGITADVLVEISLEGITDTLWAMLHVDEGVVGEYEFPGADVPVTVNDTIIMDPFAIGEVAQSIAGVAMTTEGFSTLVQAVQAAGLVDTLQTDGPFTLFAPTDEAFAAIPADTLDALLADPEELAQVLLYHLIPGTVIAADITNGMEAETAQGDTVTFTVGDDGAVLINDATVTETDIPAYNGVIHVIDQVLMPLAAEMTDAEMTDEAVAEEEAASEEAASAEEEMVTPSVAAADQESDGTSVTVAAVTAAQVGWMVIHADDNGAPGPVLGETAVSAGESADVVVPLAEPLSGDSGLWAMLHVDDGEIGVYEFPGPDGPVLVDDVIVMAPFTAMVAAMADEVMAATATMTDTEVMTDTAMMETDMMTDTEVVTDTAMMETAMMTDTEVVTDTAMMGDLPSVTVIDQGSTGTNVAVIQAVAAQAGWMVIHADNNGAPGAVLGQASLPVGTTDNIIVTLDEPITGEMQLWAMLHIDEGEMGVYEFPGPDAPVIVDDAIVMSPFTAIVTGGDEAMATATEEVPAETPTEEAMTEEAPAEEATATPEPSEEPMAAAPDMLPQTGFAAGAATSQLPVVFLVIAALFTTAIITRRRTR